MKIEQLFRQTVEAGCSDLHLAAEKPPLFRREGEMVSLGDAAPLSASEVREMLLSIAPQEQSILFGTENDCDFSYEIPGLARFRCNLFMEHRGMGGVFRVIPAHIASAEELGLPEGILKFCHRSKGLVLVTGPTGSGKSTTLAAMIDHLNQTRCAHIITIEDPIEFVHTDKKCVIHQREVGVHTRDFKSALRAALREDPDIVLVGEMRDLDTVAIAIQTAETGHLVLATLHTNTATSSVDRIIDQFPPSQQNQIRAMLSESLVGVVAQTLCRKKGGGRVAAFEILQVNSAVRNLIREGKTFQIPSVMQTGRTQGMQTLNDALVDLVTQDLVDPKDAFRKSLDPVEFKELLQRKGKRLEPA